MRAVVVGVSLVSLILALCACDGSRGVPPTPVPTPSATPGNTSPTPPPPPVIPLPTSRTLSGVVREVNGGPLANVTVYTNVPNSPTSLTDADGTFTITGVTGGFLVFQERSHRWADWRISRDQPDVVSGIVAKMQPNLTVSPASALTNIITSDDLTYSDDLQNSYWDGYYLCGPCKEIRIDPSAQGPVLVHLRWSGSVPLSLWAGVYYGTGAVVARGKPGESELTFRSTAKIDTLLVGIDGYQAQPAPLDHLVPFEVTLEQPN